MTGRPARVEGNGPPVVLLHSAVADHGMWDEVANAIAGAYTVIRYDLRGFGASPAPTVGFRHVDDLVAVLDQVGISAAAVVGNSFGGRVALELAAAMPARVTRLVLLAAPIPGWDWSGAVREYGAAEEEALAADDLDAAVRLNLDMWVRGPARQWSDSLLALADRVSGPLRTTLANQRLTENLQLDDGAPPVGERLGQVRAPTLVGVGDQDVPDFVAIAERLVAGIPDARLVRFPGAGHLIPLEQPDGVADHLRRFLAG